VFVEPPVPALPPTPAEPPTPPEPPTPAAPALLPGPSSESEQPMAADERAANARAVARKERDEGCLKVFSRKKRWIDDFNGRRAWSVASKCAGEPLAEPFWASGRFQ